MPARREALAGTTGDGAATPFVDRLNPGEQVSSVRLCAGAYVDSIQLTTNQRVLPVHGGSGGDCQVFALAAGERIFRVFGSAGVVIDRLGFVTTSGRTLGPLGGGGGQPFSMTVDGDVNGVFRGWAGMQGTFNGLTLLVQVNLIGDWTGGPGGAAFLDRMQPDEKVNRIAICYRPDAYVQSVQLQTNLGLRAKHGTDWAGLPCVATVLNDGEYVIELFGAVSGYVNSLGFATNTGRRVGPLGGPGGTGFSQTVAGGRFMGWFGRSGDWLDKIGLMTAPAGEPGAFTFADQLPAGDRVSAVEVCVADGYGQRVVKSLRALLASGRSLPLNGGRANASTVCQVLNMGTGEFIVEMYGRSGAVIDSVGFRTSAGRELGPFGGAGGGTAFSLRNPSTSEFLGFAGRFSYDGYVQALDFGAPDVFAPVAAPDAAAASNGWWSDMMAWPLTAVHASMLSDGRLLTYGTDASGTQGAQFIYDVWNPAQGGGASSHLTLPNGTGTDLFCSAQTLLPDGKVLLAGGDNRQQGGYNRGVRDVNYFNPATNALEPTLKLNNARWYASQTMLPSGRILVTGGVNELGQAVAEPELFTPGQGWKRLTMATDAVALARSYPRVFVPPKVGTLGDQVYIIPTGTNRIYRLDVDANGGLGATVNTGVLLPEAHDWQRPAATYAPGKVLVQLNSGATVLVQWPTAAGALPTVSAAGSLSQPRLWSSFVVLPTGEVLAVGGASGDNALVGLAQQAAIWNPSSRAWRSAATELRPRLYHSTAMLLADGRVLSAGGGAPGPVINLNAQLYSPPYLFAAGMAGTAAPRPAITSAPTAMGYNSAVITLQTPQGSSIARVTLARLGSATHSFGFDQRFMDLPIANRTASSVSARGPVDAFAAPPGRYLLTLVDNAGVPSVSRVVTVN